MASARVMNFDKVLSGTDKLVYIQPPEGKTWVILAASVALGRRADDLTFLAWLEDAPFSPYRDPQTGEMRGCGRCVNLVQVSTRGFQLFPLVGGYTTNVNGQVLQGQTLPIIVNAPNRFMIAVTPEHGGLSHPLPVFVRLTVVER